MWYLLDRRLQQADDPVVTDLIEELVTWIERLQRCRAVFQDVYAKEVARVVRQLEDCGIVVRWGD